MTTNKNSLKKSMLRTGILFLVILCVLISAQNAWTLKTSLDRRNYSHLKDIVTYVEHTTDADDLRECIETLTPSEKYNELQQRLNTMVDDFNVRFIYLVIPAPDRSTIYSVCSSTSDAERARGEEDYPIMYADEDFYSPDQIVPYVEAWSKVGEFSAYESPSDYFGPCYTVCKPLVDSNGEIVALICADLDLMTMRRSVNAYVFSSVGLIILTMALFSFGVAGWLKRFVTVPISELERSAREFAKKSHDRVDLEDLAFNTPNFFRGDEIQSLSESIQQMSEDMKGYVEDFLSAEKRAESAEEEVEDITKLANEDALTHAKSKVAYDARKAELTEHIAAGNAQFALVSIDLIGLKRINDIHGLENGNKYIISGYEVIHAVFGDIPIYRVFGDQFVVILEGDIYRNRDELYAVLEERFQQVQEDEKREVWERCSAAVGMTEFFPDADQDVDQVYRRAELIMTRNKRIMKKQRGD